MRALVTRSMPDRTPVRMHAAVTARKPKVREMLSVPLAVNAEKELEISSALPPTVPVAVYQM